MEYKIGDRVRITNEESGSVGLIGIVSKIDGNKVYAIWNDVPNRETWVYEHNLKLASKAKPEKQKTFVVIYNIRGCDDPTEWFETLAKAKKRAKELGEDSEHRYTDIKFGELKTLYSVSPSVKISQIKI